MKKIYTLIILLSLTHASFCQSWQWGKRGGSVSAMNPLPWETVIDMATDQHNNVYVMSNVGQTVLDVDGHPKGGYGPENIMISSFKCDGTFRWVKVLGSYSNITRAQALKVDTMGHVYASVFLLSPTSTTQTATHIDQDSILPIGDHKTMFLTVYDTAGNFIKLHAPQPDTIGYLTNNSYGMDVDVDNAGNVYWLCHLAPGLLGDGIGQVITSDSFYILKYNSAGSVVGIIPLNISGSGFNGKMAHDPNNGRFYFYGYLVGSPSVSIGGNPITHSIYITAFSSTGQFIWKKENSNKESVINGRVCIGNSNSLYITGTLSGLIGSDVDTMCSFPFSFNVYGGPFVIKLDSNGVGIWNKIGVVNGATGGEGVTVRTNNEVVIVGDYPGKLKWSGYPDSLNLAPNTLYDVFITRFNAQTGAVIGMDTLASHFGYEEHSSAIVSDKSGNVYIGGYLTGDIYVANDTLVNAGGESDFFIAKYGSSNCSTQAVENPPLTTTEIRVYPNPTNDVLHIDNLQEANNYRVINIIGTTVQQGTLQTGSNNILIQNLSSGLYFLELANNKGERQVVRVVKE